MLIYIYASNKPIRTATKEEIAQIKLTAQQGIMQQNQQNERLNPIAFSDQNKRQIQNTIHTQQAKQINEQGGIQFTTPVYENNCRNQRRLEQNVQINRPQQNAFGTIPDDSKNLSVNQKK